MPETATTEASREELLAEFVIHSAVDDVLNRIRWLLEEDRDIHDRLPGLAADSLIIDPRYSELYGLLYPEDDEPDAATNAESLYIAARILRTIAYHADHLREEAARLFTLADKYERQAGKEASNDA